MHTFCTHDTPVLLFLHFDLLLQPIAHNHLIALISSISNCLLWFQDFSKETPTTLQIVRYRFAQPLPNIVLSTC